MRNLCALLLILVLLPSVGSSRIAVNLDAPDSGFVSNLAIDIIEHSGWPWLATGEGVNYSEDGGKSWLLYNTANGLVSDDVSAMFSYNGRLFIATNHSTEAGVISDGLMYTDNDGMTWTEVDFSNVQFFPGGDRIVYDIAGHYDINNASNPEGYNDDWVVMSSFASGTLVSRDGGESWQRIFYSPFDSLNYVAAHAAPPTAELSLRNLLFACAVDTSHGDTVSIWGGTAGGLVQHIFVDPDEKVFVERINDIAYCDQCTDPDSAYVFVAGGNGVMRGNRNGRGFYSRFVSHGLSGPYAGSIFDFRGRVFVATYTGEGGTFAGLDYSDDRGESFYASSMTLSLAFAGGEALGFASMDERLYMAGGHAGLYVSTDTGESWSHIFVDSSNTAPGNPLNEVNSLLAFDSSLYVGTDTALAILHFGGDGIIDSQSVYYQFTDVLSSNRIDIIRLQQFLDSNLVDIDSTALWTVNKASSSGPAALMRSIDGGANWDRMKIDTLINDVNFKGDTVLMVGEEGVKFVTDYRGPDMLPFTYNVIDSISTDRFDAEDTITVFAIDGDNVMIGSDGGFAISNNKGIKYRLHRVNHDTLRAEVAVNFSASISGISGNWVQSMGIQYLNDFDATSSTPRTDSGMARIWMSNNVSGENQSIGLSVGVMIPVNAAGIPVDPDSTELIDRFERLWAWVNPDVFAWNFAFDNETVFAATNAGVVYYSGNVLEDTFFVWDTLEYIDLDNNEVLAEGTSAYAVEVIGDYLWVGTDDGVVRVDLDDPSLRITDAFFVLDSANETYAFPIPFRHSQGDVNLNFHYYLKTGANITLEIYDFAMNLVIRQVDNLWREAGPHQTSDVDAESWDGTNGQGEKVAVGMYYYKLTTSTGEHWWGKIAVIP